ncbi:MAG TPA: site-2 protease family protein [Thermoleophilia bacterium]|nr:site-2 protease family protein [Thermoleophilia bacterium]
MGSGFKVARLFGIEISITPSWILIFALVTWSVATGWFNLEAWSTATLWVVSVVAALLFFVSVLAHELAHSFVARAQGIPVRGITLWMLGGVSTIESEATSPGREALLAGIGPVSSLAIGLACWYGGHAIETWSIGRAVLIYLGFINLLLAVFNMVPGFPLDGSKVLHAALWGVTHDALKATRWAARAGLVIGVLMVAYGLFSLFGFSAGFSGYVGGLWFAFIGWFVVQASQMAGRQSRAESSLTAVSVGELMSLPPTWIPGDITLRKAANDYFLALNARCLPVQDDHGTLEGMICLSDLQRTDQGTWGVDQVQDAMTAAAHLQTIAPDESAATALHRLATTDVDELAVVQDGRFIGFVDRLAIGRYLQTGHAPRHPAHDAAGA